MDAVEVARPDGAGHTLLLAAARVAGPTTPARLVLGIDGNRDGRMVLFDHGAHEERAGGKSACALCHHLDLPLDRNTGCAACHRDMYEPTPTFSHSQHIRALPGRPVPRVPRHGRSRAHAAERHGVHRLSSGHSPVANAIIAEPHERWYAAAGYLDAMHGLCVACHDAR
jgi:hypothetical protein